MSKIWEEDKEFVVCDGEKYMEMFSQVEGGFSTGMQSSRTWRASLLKKDDKLNIL